MGRIWLIGGTRDSARAAEAIAALGLPCTVTVASAPAAALYPQTPYLQVRVGRMAPEALDGFLQQAGIAAVVDASHPHASAISQGAMTAAARQGVPYLRYERPELPAGAGTSEFPNFEALLASDRLRGERVLLAVGYRPLARFAPWQEAATLFARVLPRAQSLQAAQEAGFSPDRIVALRPPLGAELERALWRHWQVSLVVTKASGSAGGEAIKRRVAAELGVPLIAIARPQLAYPQQTSELQEVVAFCRRQLAP